MTRELLHAAQPLIVERSSLTSPPRRRMRLADNEDSLRAGFGSCAAEPPMIVPKWTRG